MPLYKRKNHPRKAIRITHAADLIGCSAESIRTGAVGNFQLFKLNPDKNNSPLLMYQSELEIYLEKRGSIEKV